MGHTESPARCTIPTHNSHVTTFVTSAVHWASQPPTMHARARARAAAAAAFFLLAALKPSCKSVGPLIIVCKSVGSRGHMRPADFPPNFSENQLALSYAAPFLFCR
eukprot:COSAG01_NODE_2108_length_8408_cov_138.235768_7_plen_106_part_00